MLKSILVGLDGSALDAAAVELGIEWAKRFNALLVGLGIADDATMRTPDAGLIGGGYHRWEQDEELAKEARHRVKQSLASFATRCAEADVSFNLLQDAGLAYEAIVQESQRCDLVLFGHETHFHLGAADQPDETLWNVLKREPRPVVIAPRELKPGSSVVVAYNGSPHADRALQAFQASGLDLDEEVYVLSVDADREEAARQADRASEFLRLHQINAVTHARGPVDSVSQSILEEVRLRNARLLVMGAYGHSAVREFLLGSTTTTILKQSPVPVFICH